jgi:dihydroorotate dehydrogenase electron transfer subunit
VTATDPRLDLARVRQHEETFPDFYRLELELPPDYPEPLPGQYLNLRAGSRTEPLFRRPFGVVGFHREADAAVVELYYAVVGRGTAAMSRWRVGDQVDCLGPLGSPYVVDTTRPALLVAGGRGAAPLLYLYRLLCDAGHRSIRFALGARSEGLLFGRDRLDDKALLVATDDGSAGFHGTVIDALEVKGGDWLREEPVLYVCGPDVFLRAAALLAERHRLGCQVSLEGLYGCGLGLCRGCAVPLRDEERYLMQCQEGPVVDAARIDWGRLPHE